MSIRWRKSDIAELRNYVRKFNAKITRVSNKKPSIKGFLPARLNVKDIQEKITERKDFNNLKKSINRFMQKGAENLVTLSNGIVVTEYQKKEIECQRRIVNQKRKKARKEVGELQPGRMGMVEQWANRELEPPEKVRKDLWNSYVTQLEKQSKESFYAARNDMYLANWTQALFTTFGELDATDILKATAEIDRRKLIERIISNAALSLEFVYDLTELQAKKQRLLDEIELL